MTPHLHASLLNPGLDTVLIPHFLCSNEDISRAPLFIYLFYNIFCCVNEETNANMYRAGACPKQQTTPMLKV
jgi:hypothetical protein